MNGEVSEIIEEHIRLFREEDGPFSPHDVALAALDTACARGLVDQADDVGLDLACMNFEERARYLMSEPAFTAGSSPACGTLTRRAPPRG